MLFNITEAPRMHCVKPSDHFATSFDSPIFHKCFIILLNLVSKCFIGRKTILSLCGVH